MPRKRNHNKMALIRILCLWYVIDTFGGDSISIVLTKPSIIIIDITRSNITRSHTQYKPYMHKISPTLRSPKTTQISPSLRNTFCKYWLQEIGCARRWRNVPLLKGSYWPPRYHINAAVVTAGCKRIKVFWSCLKFQQHVMNFLGYRLPSFQKWFHCCVSQISPWNNIATRNRNLQMITSNWHTMLKYHGLPEDTPIV